MSRNGARDRRRGRHGTGAGRKCQNRRMRPTVMVLEERTLLSTVVVNNPTDTPVAGETDLRQAILQAGLNGIANTIDFDPTVFASAGRSL